MAEAVKTASAVPAPKQSVIDVFIAGARKGLVDIGFKYVIPSIMMSYVIVSILNITGIMDLAQTYCAPVMGIFGLSGAAIIPYITGVLSKGGGTAACATMLLAGQLSPAEVTILFPAIQMSGGLVNQWVRIVCVSGVPSKNQKWMFAVAFIDSFLALWVMGVIVRLFA